MKMIFVCEVITPMFMAGGDGSSIELRPSEFKGMMRFWWRAIKAESDLNRLRKEEAEIFGSSDEKIGKSKFSLRITNIKLNNYSFPQHLLHSDNKTSKFQGIKPESSFKMILECRKDVDKFGNILEIAFLLGGFGKRSRRGFGSIHINKWNFADESSLRKYILDKLNSINEDFNVLNNKIIKKTLPERELYPFINQISFGKKREKFDEILKKIGQVSHNNNDKSLVLANTRMASPIYVSIIKLSNGFIPIITTLKKLKNQERFIEELMR